MVPTCGQIDYTKERETPGQIARGVPWFLGVAHGQLAYGVVTKVSLRQIQNANWTAPTASRADCP